MRDIVSLFGSDNAFVLSVDDKAKAAVDVTAVTKQAPLIMHVTYEIQLPDHYFAKATKHKLTPFVYAACEIFFKSRSRNNLSGPTNIAIRSGKHNCSTAYTHVRDFDHLLGLKEFNKVVKHENAVKPIDMFFCDGGPDKNQRFLKTLDIATQHFKKYNLDAPLISTHARGLYGYNQAERIMAPLSKVLSGILLPHETFGTHLDSSRKTINTNLEKLNFKAVGEILAKVWEEIVLGKFPVVADYVENDAKDPVNLNEKWTSFHCGISQYLLQIMCCGDFETTGKSVFSSHFLPAPVPVRQISEGPAVTSVTDIKASDRFVDLWKRIGIQQLIPNSGFSQMPYYLYCPSLKAKVKNRVCKQCGIYYPSITTFKRHRQNGCGLGVLGNTVIDEKEDVSHEEEENSEILIVGGDDDHAPIINIY